MTSKQPDAAPPVDVLEISALAGGLAHEIRNSLSTLRMNLQLLEEDWRAAGEGDQIAEPSGRDVVRRSQVRLRGLLDETQRLERVLEDFLEFVRSRELRADRRDLNELVSELGDFFRPQAEAHGIHLEVVCDDQPVYARVDDAMLKQALLNLVLNAQQAMPQGGRLTMRVDRRGNEWGRIEVMDTGAGIAPGQLGRIFDAYYSTKKGGTGLGLPMARRIVSAHGGSVEVDSAPGEGTTSTMLLPLATDADLAKLSTSAE